MFLTRDWVGWLLCEMSLFLQFLIRPYHKSQSKKNIHLDYFNSIICENSTYRKREIILFYKLYCPSINCLLKNYNIMTELETELSHMDDDVLYLKKSLSHESVPLASIFLSDLGCQGLLGALTITRTQTYRMNEGPSKTPNSHQTTSTVTFAATKN